MTTAGHPTRWRKRTPAARLALWAAWLAVVVVLVAAWRSVSERTTWAFVADAPVQAADLLRRGLPPAWTDLPGLARPLWDTLSIATLGTLFAVAAAAPLALLAARNTTPHRLLRPAALLAIVASRSVNSLLWALLAVAVLGPGLLAGILAVGLRSVGFVAKLVYEAIEETDPAPAEAVAATGAGRAQVLAWGIVPQVLPAFAGVTVFRWDINVREAAIVGLVGAGGIGLQLDAAVSALEWQRVAAIFTVILALVAVAEFTSARVRAWLS